MKSCLSIICFPLPALFLFLKPFLFLLSIDFELAGTLQGLLPGYLGGIGRASLDQEQIKNLLDIVACENEITYLFCENPATKSSSAPLKLRSVKSRKRKDIDGYRAILHSSKSLHMRRRYDSSRKWMPLTKRQKRRLELSARLLRSSQEYFVAKLDVFST